MSSAFEIFGWSGVWDKLQAINIKAEKKKRLEKKDKKKHLETMLMYGNISKGYNDKWNYNTGREMPLPKIT